MIDFNIKHYLAEEKEVIKDPHRFDNFYGSIEDKPTSEQILFAAQQKYLNEGRDPKVWSEMFNICWPYMQSLIKKRQIGKKFIEKDDLDDKTTAATLAFMSQYLTNPEFEVGASFAGMMSFKIIEVMYKQSTDDKTISLSTEINDDGKNTIEDLISAERVGWVSPEDDVCRVDPTEIIDEVLKELDDVIDSFYLKTVVRAYVLLSLKQPKNRHAKRLFLLKWATDLKTERLIEYVILTIHNRLKEAIGL